MNRTYKDGEHCTEEETIIVQKGICPDCGNGLRQGPTGGLSINVYCIDGQCGSRFNEMGPFGVDRISDAQPNRPTGSEGPYR